MTQGIARRLGTSGRSVRACGRRRCSTDDRDPGEAQPGQPKLVRVARGRAWDVVVDIRRSSRTLGECEAFELDDGHHLQLYIPVGFAHGFCALSGVVGFAYKVGGHYDPATERGIAWDDADLGIPWPNHRPSISARDSSNPLWAQVRDDLPPW